jgi:hypothetical protein
MAVARASISKQQLNEAVTALAKLDRPAAVDILAKFGVLNTAELLPEAWPAVFEACEARAKIAGTS